MRKKIRGEKALRIKQAIFFNGSKLYLEIENGEGFIDFDETKIPPSYVEKSVLRPLYMEFVAEEPGHTETSSESEEEKAYPINGEKQAEKPVKEEKIEEEVPKKTSTKKSTKKKTTKKRTTTTRKKK